MSTLKELSLAIRFLSIDAVEQAQSGHPGMPLGMADIATVLWKKFLSFSPTNPHWFNRDRFVLSNGHGSMLQYALLHLTGYNLSLEEIKHFRQLHSKTPGHPECTETPGVETTTGPLGQGLANAVGMAIAEKILAAEFNHADIPLVDHFTYAFAGDGCMMEGISHEVCSLAGKLGLGKLIVFYDDNGISIDGDVDAWFTDDTASRFRSYHWHVIEGVDGHDYEAIENAIISARHEQTKPSLIICKTVIGLGSEMAGSEKVHGAPLGEKDIAQMREKYQWNYPPFEIPDHLYAQWNHIEEGKQAEQLWLNRCELYKKQNPKMYYEFLRRINGDLPDNWSKQSNAFIQECQTHEKAIATRKASQLCLENYAALLPELFGGSADLTGSNNTNWSGSKAINEGDFSGNYLYYGVREFGMAAIMNGIAVHGGFIPYGGTFLVFSDYARNAIRLSALMKQRVIYVLTHDSIGLGEDGPTHQPIEHTAMLRLTPDLDVWRPADLMETAVAWQQAIEHHTGPSCLLLSRQNLPALSLNSSQIKEIKQGGYILRDSNDSPEIILIATGSEVELALKAANVVAENGVQVRVVSMPCVERFLRTDKTYQEHVLPASIRKRVAIEAASSAFWHQFTGLDGEIIGLRQFGRSAPASDVFQDMGITVDNIVAAIHRLLN
ncbi:transketolase [Legionella yabuuchiae]|uniref:transketolase n=1 Tax=Legionella yabuuchiae TaxID=376727 RepID=UPI0010553A46|nr:transketolase [Legionella yabuuchiae]